MRPYEFLSFPPECNVRNHTFHDIAAPLSSNEFEVGSSYESDATAGSKARKIFALRNRPVSCHEQAANTHARTHARALCLIPPDGGRFSNRFSFFAPNFRIVPQIYRPPPSRTNICPPPLPCPLPLVLIRGRKTNSPREDLAIFDNNRNNLASPLLPPRVKRESVESGAIKTSGNIPEWYDLRRKTVSETAPTESLLFYSPLGE